jgi:hypothetical protein
MPVRFVITTLKPGVDPQEYEAWVLKYDRPFTCTHPNYKSYNVHRIFGSIQGAEGSGWQYVERIELESLEQHDRDLASPEGRAIIEELERRFIDASKTVYFASEIIA